MLALFAQFALNATVRTARVVIYMAQYAVQLYKTMGQLCLHATYLYKHKTSDVIYFPISNK